MSDFFWSTQNPNGQDVRCESGEVIKVTPKSIGSIAADAGNFVWQPGGVQGGNVYNNWPDLAAAIALVRGQKTVTVNTSTAAAHVTAGAWPSITDITFVAGETSPLTVVVTIDNGATFTSSRKLVFDNVLLSYAGTAAPCIAMTATSYEVLLTNFAAISQSGGQAFAALSGANSPTLVSVVDKGAQWATGTLTVAAGCAAEVAVFDAGQISPTAASGAGTFLLQFDGASQGFVAPQTGVTTSSATNVDPQPTFVFRPGGTNASNVYTTEAALKAAWDLSPGPKWLLVDDTLGATTLALPNWNLDGATLSCVLNSTSTLLLGVGFTFSGSFRIVGELNVTSNVTTSAHVTAAGEFLTIFVEEGSKLQQTTATAFIQDGTSGVFIAGDYAGIGDGTHPVLQTNVGQTSTVQVLGGTTLLAHACKGAGTVNVIYDSASTPNLASQDTTTVTGTAISNASRVTYGAATAGNWNPNPTSVNAALDQLAADNVVKQTGNGGTGTHTVVATTGNIAKKKNGGITCGGFCAGSSAAADTITVTLVRDIGGTPAVLATQTVTTTAGQLNFNVSFTYVDTLSDTANHTYSFNVAAAAQNLTVAANQCGVFAREAS